MVWVVSRFRFKAPPGISSSCISPITMALGLTQPLTEMSTRTICWGKGGRCVRLNNLPPSCVDYLEIWEPEPVMALLFLYVYVYKHKQIQRCADKSLARLGKKQVAPLRSVMGRGIELARVGTGGGLL